MSAQREKLYRQLDDLLMIIRRDFGFEPIVYGSLGVEIILNKDFDARDIDMIIDDEIYIKKDGIVSSLSKGGYEFVPRDYLTFTKTATRSDKT